MSTFWFRFDRAFLTNLKAIGKECGLLGIQHMASITQSSQDENLEQTIDVDAVKVCSSESNKETQRKLKKLDQNNQCSHLRRLQRSFYSDIMLLFLWWKIHELTLNGRSPTSQSVCPTPPPRVEPSRSLQMAQSWSTLRPVRVVYINYDGWIWFERSSHSGTFKPTLGTSFIFHEIL